VQASILARSAPPRPPTRPSVWRRGMAVVATTQHLVWRHPDAAAIGTLARVVASLSPAEMLLRVRNDGPRARVRRSVFAASRAGALALALGCSSPPSDFVCSSSAACVRDDVPGVCEASGYCSFPDSACGLPGRRYAQHAADLSETCVAADPASAGCSDATREAFIDVRGQPDIAGCSGRFQGGIVGAITAEPRCGRLSGNTGTNPDDAQCAVEDLCAEGWSVCRGFEEVSGHAASGACDLAGAPLGIWITRQTTGTDGSCGAPTQDNLVGCGSSIGVPAHASCAPLDRMLDYVGCNETQTWKCGGPGDAAQEADVVKKQGSTEGGVLCCRRGT
jgi:hypothetical protein